MVKYRHIYVEFWKDLYIRNLTSSEQLAYLYLLTNQDTQQCGIYTLDVDVFEIKLKCDNKEFNRLISKFIKDNKIKFNDETNEIAIKNWNKWNNSKSPKVVKHIYTELLSISDKSLINYCYGDSDLITFDNILEKHNENCKPQYKMSGSFSIFYLNKNINEPKQKKKNKLIFK